MKQKFILFLCLSLSLTALMGCSGISETKAEEDNENHVDYLVSSGGEVVLPLTNFNTLNPLMTENKYYHHFSKLIFDSLFEFNNNLEAMPKLVNSYLISEDGKELTIELRNDVYWHDGEKFTSEDVAFTIDTLKYASSQGRIDNINNIGKYIPNEINRILGVKILDEYRIAISFDQGFSNILETLTFPIVPSHAFNNFQNALELDNYTPIGTGPYEFVSYEKHKSVNLKSSTSYRKGEPQIKNIYGKVLEDEELIITAFETGQINAAVALGVDWDKYKNNSRIKVLEFISNNFDFLGFNFNNEIFAGHKGAAIRKAINYGINRQDIIQKVYLGHGSQIDVPIFPDSYLVSEDAHHYGYNVDMAKRQLLSQGFRDINEDGILVDEEGHRLSFRLLTNSYNIYKTKTAEKIKEDLKNIGIEIILDFDDNYYENITNEMKKSEVERIDGKIDSGDFDIVLSSWQLSYIPDLSFLFHSNNQNMNNFIDYKNEEMDLAIEKTLNSISKNEKIESFRELQKIIISDLPYVSLFFNNKALLVDSGIIGELNPSFYNLYNGLENCFFASKPE